MNTGAKVSIKDLRCVDLFAGLSDQELENIAKACILRRYKPGEYCAIENETTDELLIVNEGTVAIEMRCKHTHDCFAQALGIGTLTKGNVVSWSALVEPHVLAGSARCIEEVQIISIKASDLQLVFRERPSIEPVVMKNLATIINSRLTKCRAHLAGLVTEMINQGTT